MAEKIFDEDEENGTVFVGYLDLLMIICLFGVVLRLGFLQLGTLSNIHATSYGTLTVMACLVLAGLLSETVRENALKVVFAVSLVTLPVGSVFLMLAVGGVLMAAMLVLCLFSLMVQLCCGIVRFLMLNYSGLPFAIAMCVGAVMTLLTFTGLIADVAPTLITIAAFSSMLGALLLRDERLFYKEKREGDFLGVVSGVIAKAKGSLIGAGLLGITNGLLLSVTTDLDIPAAPLIPSALFIGMMVFSIPFIGGSHRGLAHAILYPLSTVPFLIMILWGGSSLTVVICVSMVILFTGAYIGYHINLAYDLFEISVTHLGLVLWALLLGGMVGILLSAVFAEASAALMGTSAALMGDPAAFAGTSGGASWLLYFAPPAIIVAQYLDLGPLSDARRSRDTGRFVEAGGSAHDVSLSEKAGRACDGFDLSPRQREIVLLLAKGRNAKYIADELSISVNTAKTHIHNIYQRMGVNSQQELISSVEEWHD